MYDWFNPSYKSGKQFETAPPIWVEWSYEADEWAEFDASEWSRVNREARRYFWGWSGAAVGVGVIFAIIGHNSKDSWLAFFPSAILVLFGLIAGAAHRGANYRRHRARQRGPRVVSITPLGFYEAGLYVPLVKPALAILRVWVQTSTPRLLRFNQQQMGGRSSNYYEVRLPVPSGHEAEALQLAERFQRELVRRL